MNIVIGAPVTCKLQHYSFADEQHPNNDYPSSQESLVEEEDRRNNYGFDDYFSDLPGDLLN